MRGLLPAALMVLVALGACSSLGLGDIGGSEDSPPVTAQEAQRLLKEQGYTDVRNLHKTPDGWQASASRNSNPVTVDIDSYGIIHTE